MAKLALYIGVAVLVLWFAIGAYKTTLFITKRSKMSEGDKE